jgi:hypothetical protein
LGGEVDGVGSTAGGARWNSAISSGRVEGVNLATDLSGGQKFGSATRVDGVTGGCWEGVYGARATCLLGCVI